MRLFVYGTLRRDECRHSVLGRFNPTFVKEVKTASTYKLLDLGAFPAMVHGDRAVIGELYDVSDDAIPTFDMIEGVPYLFNRNTIALQDGTNAIAYIFMRDTDAPEIITGDWKNKEPLC